MSNIRSQNWLMSRRAVLRGIGATIALPLLNAMTPLGAADPVGVKGGKPRRSVFVYIPNGVNGMSWQIKESGRNFQFSSALKSLEPHRDAVTVFSGLFQPNGLGQAHVCADTWLTNAKIDSSSSRAYKNTVSCDQLMAAVTQDHTRFSSLELSISGGTGQPNNSNTLSFSHDGIPLPAEENPKTVFDRLFGVEAGGVAAQRQRLDRKRSVLDTVLGDAKAQRTALGAEDRTKLDEYLTSVRDIEQRAQRMDAWLDVPKPQVDGGKFQRNVSKDLAGEYYRTMYDLILLALKTDMTRVVTYMSGTEGNGLAIKEIGITQSRHNLSHHNGQPEILDRLTKADTFLMEQFSYFLDQLAKHQEDGESLLDRTMVLCGSGMSYGHSHANSNLPILLVGGRGLGLKHGQHIDYTRPHLEKDYTLTYEEWQSLCGKPKDDNARLSNVQLTMLQKMGVEIPQFVDSVGPVSEIVA